MHEKQKVCPHSVLLNASTYVSRHIGHALSSSSEASIASIVNAVAAIALVDGPRDAAPERVKRPGLART